jgi:uncharacterized protein
MADLLSIFVPPELSPWSALLLVGLAFLTSAASGALGLGGGQMMLAVLAWLLPPILVIPVHGVVQIGSNAGRAYLMRRDIARGLILPFALGALVGTALGAQLVIAVPTDLLRMLLGSFILYSVWTPRFRPGAIPDRAFVWVGAGTSLLSMFVGGTGPLVASFLIPEKLKRHGVVATQAACMTVQHSLKVAAFTALGFSFLPWLPLLLSMIGLGFLGTMAGKHLLDHLPERGFAFALRALISGLALLLLWEGASGLIGY